MKKAMNSPEPDNRQREEKRSMWLQIARYSQIGFMLPAATLVGWFLGALLDKWLHTKWIYIAGLVLGMVTGFVELIRMLLAESDAETKSGNK